MFSPFYRLFTALSLVILLPVSLVQAAPSVADALKLRPVQKGADYDTPEADKIGDCTIKAEKINGSTAWVIRGPQSEILREFGDTNGDNVVDTWSYFRDGLEVYRDIDSNNNGKADQYRWFHSAGIRWALDQNEDNIIDSWKLISPEEVSEEVVGALSDNDLDRFKRLLLSPEDIKKLGLDAARAEQLEKRIAAAPDKFKAILSAPDLKPGFVFSDFGGIKPGMVPAGSQGVTKDLMVYESVWAMVKNGTEHRQLQLGTLISVGGAWKLIDGPTLGTGQQVAGGFFFDPGGQGIGERAIVGSDVAPTEKLQGMLADLEKIDEELNSASQADKPSLNKRRASVLLAVANSSADPSEREQWLKNLADSVSAAAQEGSFPGGVAYLRKLEEQLAESEDAKDLLAYFEFHRMAAEYYGITLTQPDVDISKAQEQWMKDLEAFVEAHPTSEHGAEAIRAMAMGYEMSGQTNEAIKWYRKILSDYPKNIAAKLAQGAITRLSSEGKEITLKATDLKGEKVDLKDLQGKAVVIQYWTTTSDVCKADHAVLKELVQKYAPNSLDVISICLDFNRDAVIEYLQANRLPWKQLYEEGGFDGRLANELGVVTVPLTIMVGPDGKVISNNIQTAEIETELKKL
ncbi:TlpA disulfide reductase family protein [Bythopirellula polymerisocia]|uniref:Thiol-disulfide oxidoreductase ResA n=1 Tax=Bythopirellula polymerisocia TaxID=2528003 RepID=A0A5C6CY04_9BACT|nr:TlpA disulfide reductase family protein [Bythopirellula polymerisocia]TWU27529.1 Thiol-disulfide oxidoreductase ResA [Bythopirellula polymerisocia]